MDRFHLAIGLDDVQACREVVAYVRVEVRTSVMAGQHEQRRIGHRRRVVGAALAVLAAGQLVDALGEPGVDALGTGGVGPAGVDAGEGRAHQPTMVRGVHATGREGGARQAQDPLDRRPQPGGRFVGVLVQQVVGQVQVDDREGGVRRVAVRPVLPQSVVVLLLGERVHEVGERAEQRGGVVVRRALVHVHRHERTQRTGRGAGLAALAEFDEIGGVPVEDRLGTGLGGRGEQLDEVGVEDGTGAGESGEEGLAGCHWGS